MSKLIQLRQRIKSIETIQKITHAMRLIAMSSHSHLKHKHEIVARYQSEINRIFTELSHATPTWKNPIIHPPVHEPKTTLIILVGSQKGLCGSFNSNLFKSFEAYHFDHRGTYHFIAVGQKAIDFLSEHHHGNLKHSYEKFTIQRLSAIAHEIAHVIMYARSPYHSVMIMSNTSKGFFSQRPTITQLIPLVPNETVKTSLEYSLEQDASTLLDSMLAQYLEAQIYAVLFNSLVAEHAARFLSMDTATRNANELLIETRLEFNKQRQAKITKELTELSGSY